MKNIMYHSFYIVILGLVLTACSPDTNKPDTNKKEKKPAKSLHLRVPDVIEIASEKYQNQGYTSVTFAGKKLRTIGKNAFKGNKITSLILPESVKVIEDGAFENNNIETLVLNEKITKIGKNAFKGNKLKEVTINSKTITLGSDAFTNRENVFPPFPTFKVRSSKVVQEIIIKLTTKNNAEKKIVPVIKTANKSELKQKDIDSLRKAKINTKSGDAKDKLADESSEVEVKKPSSDADEGDGEADESGEVGVKKPSGEADEGDDEADESGEVEVKKPSSDAEEGDDEADESGEVGVKKPSGDAEEGDDEADESDIEEESNDEHDEASTKATQIRIYPVKRFTYTRNKKTGKFIYLTARPFMQLTISQENEEFPYFLTSSLAREHKNYYLYKKDDYIRIRVTFDIHVSIDKREVARISKISGNHCNGYPYIELTFDRKNKRSACLQKYSSTPKSLEFSYQVKDGDNAEHIHIKDIIKQYKSIKDRNKENVQKILSDVMYDDINTTKIFRTFIETTSKPNVPPIPFTVRITCKDTKNKSCGVTEPIKVEVIFKADEIQGWLPEKAELEKDDKLPYFTLYINNTPRKAYYTDIHHGEKNTRFIFFTSLPFDGRLPEGNIAIRSDSLQRNGAPMKDIANRIIDTEIKKPRTTRWRVVGSVADTR